MSLLSPEFQGRLAALELAVRQALPSTLRGDRRSPSRKGISLEFADYRNYVAGDDVRHLDWSSYARLDQLIIKLYHDEEDLQVHILVDDSRSMHYGESSKQLFARQVAASLAWVALAHSHRVSLALLGDEVDVVPLSQGGGAMGRFLARLSEEPAEGRKALHENCRDFMNRTRSRGVIVLISDLMDRAGLEASLRELQRPATEVDVLHVLAEEEVAPKLEGDLRLVDLETGQRVEVSLTQSLIRGYERTVRAFIAECAEVCRRRGVAYVQASTAHPFEEFMMQSLVREGVLR